jgi:hypothetical protein
VVAAECRNESVRHRDRHNDKETQRHALLNWALSLSIFAHELQALAAKSKPATHPRPKRKPTGENERAWARSPKAAGENEAVGLAAALAQATKQEQPRSEETRKHDPNLAKGPNKNESRHDHENQKFCSIKMNKIRIQSQMSLRSLPLLILGMKIEFLAHYS